MSVECCGKVIACAGLVFVLLYYSWLYVFWIRNDKKKEYKRTKKWYFDISPISIMLLGVFLQGDNLDKWSILVFALLTILVILAEKMFNTIIISGICELDTKNKHTPKKKNICLLIGCPGSGAKRFLKEQTNLQNEYSEILFYESFYKAQFDINSIFSLDTSIDTFLIYGHLGCAGDGRDWKDFLTRIPIKYDYKHPLYHYVPDVRNYISGTVIKLSRKDGYWLLQKLRADDHKIIY